MHALGLAKIQEQKDRLQFMPVSNIFFSCHPMRETMRLIWYVSRLFCLTLLVVL